MAKQFFDRVKLNFSHSMIIPGQVGDSLINVSDLERRIKEDNSSSRTELEKFGLFDLASPNFHTYYPNVTAADIKPEEQDYVNPTFRALSMVIVHRKHNPIDFTKGDILKASMSKLVGQSVYANHEAMVGNEIGVVKSVSWQEGYITNDGIKVPAGINSVFKIDAKSHPKIARGVMQDPPSIHSTSVTVSFGWEKSHPKLTDQDFAGKIGQFGSDGQLIRRVANKIGAYHEISFVPHGADPFAQKINDGKIVNPTYANDMYSFSEGPVSRSKSYFFSYKDVDEVSLSQETTTLLVNNNNNTDTNMKDYLLGLIALMAITAPENSTDEQLQQLIVDGLKPIKANADTVTSLNDKITVLEKANRELTLKAGIADKVLADKLDNTIRLYRLVKKEKVDDKFIASLSNFDFDTLTSLENDYQTSLDDSLPLTCSDCKGHNISRQASSVNPIDPSNLSFEDASEKIKKDRMAKFLNS